MLGLARIVRVGLIAALALLASAVAVADAPRTGRPGAGARARSDAAIRGSRVLVDGRVVFRGARRERLISAVAWSAPGDAIAFATRDRDRISLIVVLVAGGAAGHVMRWPVPPHRVDARRARVTWLGPRRVSLGRDRLQPSVVASWNLSR